MIIEKNFAGSSLLAEQQRLPKQIGHVVKSDGRV